MTGLFGRVKSASLDRFGFRVTVEDVHEPAPGFALITLVGAGLTENAWRAGDRVSVRTPNDELRNYTPFDWDGRDGRAHILCAGRATGSGTRFLTTLSVGDEVQLLGPKRSVDLQLDTAPIIVGDETVLGLCAAWAGSNPLMPATVLLESADTAACEVAAHAVDVDPRHIVHDRDSLMALVIETARDNPDAPLVLSGRAQSIAAVRAALKNAGLSNRQVKVKAYWDENRSGLD